ncbi:hypothetical protein [Roseibium sediminicola]|uniref:Uncharacterized protein n=1 Tax=Roseibium sediminicola TaxID=2933272 RepID=A0ABT0GVE1_9HYPH|nr:hypothetical protein [Roseibium sp. CAU 1639]MCK7613399.1 hypothetical protein [Roseibium sp. CAU 1639]
MAGLVLPLLSGLVFFWPERTIANVDDLFFVPWAMEVAETRRHWNSLLAVQFPELTSYHLQPRLHLILAGTYFAVAGASTATLVLFEFLCYALTSLAFVLLCLRLNLRLAVLFTPLIFAPLYVVSGFRLELTGGLLFMAGLLLSLPLLTAAGTGRPDESRRESAAGISGKLLLAIAPLAAPSVFAWSLGAIAVLELWRLLTRRAGLGRILLEGAVALSLALSVFAISIDFEFAEFLAQFTYHASRSVGHGFNEEAVLRAALFAVCAFALRRRKATAAAMLCACLAAGQLIAAFLHDKALIRNLAASMVFLLTVDAGLNRHWQWAKAMLFAAVFVVVSVNFFSFYLFADPAENAQAVQTAYLADIADGKRVFVDETMAHHYLDHQTDGALAWTWGGTFPDSRLNDIKDLGEGDVWYLSDYTLRGYLKGHTDIARTLWPDTDYLHVPQISCVLGRHSCNLPATRWTVIRLERRNGDLLVQDLGVDREPRLLASD